MSKLNLFEKVDKQMLIAATSIGLVAAVVSILYLLLLHQFGQHAFGQLKFLLISVYATFFAFALWSYRKKQPGYHLRVREGLFIGITLNIAATLLFYISLYFILSSTQIGQEMLLMHKQALMALLEQTRQMASSIGISESDLAQTLTNINQMTGADLAVGQLAFYYGFGVVNTVLMALIFKH